jgi:hypothetical protein
MHAHEESADHYHKPTHQQEQGWVGCIHEQAPDYGHYHVLVNVLAIKVLRCCQKSDCEQW